MMDALKPLLSDKNTTCIQVEDIQQNTDRTVETKWYHRSYNNGPIQVWVEIIIEQLDKIDTVNQSFEADFTIKQSWLCKNDEDKPSDNNLHIH